MNFLGGRIAVINLFQVYLDKPRNYLFFIFHSAFLLTDHKNLQQDHCNSIYNAMMMITGVIETSTMCR